MAINITTTKSLPPDWMESILGVDSYLLESSKNLKNFEVVMFPGTISMSLDGNPLGAVKMPAGSMEALVAGTLGHASAGNIKASIEHLLKKALNASGVPAPPAPKKVAKPTPAKEAVWVAPPPAPTFKPKEGIDLSLLMAGTVLPMSKAEEIFTPVKGTSGGSRYFLIAVAEDFKVAARLKDTSVSVRFEGNLSGIKKDLEAMGVSVHLGDKEYASVHMNNGMGKEMARRIIGSMLLGLNVEYKAMANTMDVIYGKGA